MEDEPAMMGSSSSQGFCSLSRLAEITLAAEGKLEGKDRSPWPVWELLVIVFFLNR